MGFCATATAALGIVVNVAATHPVPRDPTHDDGVLYEPEFQWYKDRMKTVGDTLGVSLEAWDLADSDEKHGETVHIAIVLKSSQAQSEAWGYGQSVNMVTQTNLPDRGQAEKVFKALQLALGIQEDCALQLLARLETG